MSERETCPMGWERDPKTERYYRPNGEPSPRLLSSAINVYVTARGSAPITELMEVFKVTRAQILEAVEVEHFMFIDGDSIEMDGV